jgi:hypothetical protein
MEGRIVSMHIATAPGAPMTAITTAHLVPERGIEGDRFYASRGSDAASDATTCDVTFVEQEVLEALKSEEPQTDSGDIARRNVVIRRCSLEQLIGRTFRIGDVVLHGLAPHESCVSVNTHQATRPLSGFDLHARHAFTVAETAHVLYAFWVCACTGRFLRVEKNIERVDHAENRRALGTSYRFGISVEGGAHVHGDAAHIVMNILALD